MLFIVKSPCGDFTWFTRQNWTLTKAMAEEEFHEFWMG